MMQPVSGVENAPFLVGLFVAFLLRSYLNTSYYDLPTSLLLSERRDAIRIEAIALEMLDICTTLLFI